MSSPVYEIRIEGHLDSHWTEWFAGWHILCEESHTTLLSGSVPDQPALYGILAKINALNLTLISANRIEPIRDKRDIEIHAAGEKNLARLNLDK